MDDDDQEITKKDLAKMIEEEDKTPSNVLELKTKD